MAREGLLVGLRAALQRAVREGVAVRHEGLQVKSNGGLREIHLQVIPVRPGTAERAEINRIIFEEFARGQFLEPARRHFRRVMTELVEQGAQGIILGCTELSMLLKPEDCAVPVFDTTALHTMAVVDLALA